MTGVTWLKDDVDLSLPSTLTASSPYRSEVTVLATTSGTYTCTATLENPPPYDEEPTALPLVLTVVGKLGYRLPLLRVTLVVVVPLPLPVVVITRVLTLLLQTLR